MTADADRRPPIRLPRARSRWETEWPGRDDVTEGWGYAFCGGALVSAGLVVDQARVDAATPRWGSATLLSAPPEPRLSGVDFGFWLLCAVYLGVGVRRGLERRRAARVGWYPIARGAWLPSAAMAGAVTALVVAAAALGAGATGIGLRSVARLAGFLPIEIRVAGTIAFVFGLLLALERLRARPRLGVEGCSVVFAVVCGVGGLVIGAIASAVVLASVGRM